MPDPQFRQGMRYWRWIEGGAFYDPADQLRYDIVPQGLFGKQALIMRNTQPRSPGLMSFPLPWTRTRHTRSVSMPGRTSHADWLLP